MTRSTPVRAPAAAPRSSPTRREAAEAGRVVRAFGAEARVVLLVACPAPALARQEGDDAD